VSEVTSFNSEICLTTGKHIIKYRSKTFFRNCR